MSATPCHLTYNPTLFPEAQVEKRSSDFTEKYKRLFQTSESHYSDVLKSLNTSDLTDRFRPLLLPPKNVNIITGSGGGKLASLLNSGPIQMPIQPNIEVTPLLQTHQVKKPAWYQTELCAKICGIALMVLGALGGVGSIAMFLTASLPLIIGGVVVFGASIAIVKVGIDFFNKECWGDPAYVAKQAKKAQGMSLSTAVQTYGWDKIQDYQLLTTDQLKAKIEKHGVKDFINSYVWFGFAPINIPFKDAPWFRQMVAQEIKGKSYKEIEEYQGKKLLPKSDEFFLNHYKDIIKAELSCQLQEKGPLEFYRFQKDSLSSVFALLTPEQLNLFKKAIEGKSFKEIIKDYGTDLFNQGIWAEHPIVKIEDYRDQILEAVKDEIPKMSSLGLYFLSNNLERSSEAGVVN